MKGYTAIAGWVADVPAAVVAQLYLRVGAAPVGRPSRTTIWRVCTDTDAQALDTAIGTWLGNQLADHSAAGPGGKPGADDESAQRSQVHVRLDGKTVRGARDADGDQLHLLAALASPAGGSGAAVVVAQSEVEGAKTNEPAAARTVLGKLDLHGTTVTADALHTVKATAELIYQQRGQFVLPVKENRRALFDALDGLTWNDTPIAHSSIDIGHGRITRRTIRVRPAPADLPFPHVNQVWLIERYVTDTTGRHVSAVAQLGVTSHRTSQASPAEVAGYVQGQWAIEVLHFHRAHPLRPQDPRVATQPGHRRPAPGRTLGYHRSHPVGLPPHAQAIHHPRPHIKILKRPCAAAVTRHRGDRRGMKLREGSPGP